MLSLSRQSYTVRKEKLKIYRYNIFFHDNFFSFYDNCNRFLRGMEKERMEICKINLSMNDTALLFYVARQPEYGSEYLVGKPTVYPTDKNSLLQQVKQKFSNSSGSLL